MVFTDNLAYSLFSVSFAGLLLLYLTVSVYLSSRKKRNDFSEQMKSAIVPLLLIGIYMFVMALWGQLTWPLPGSYNILFYDPMISFGILLIAFSLSVKMGLKLEYVGFLGLLVGIMVMVYGFYGYSIHLTAAPIALLGMYLLYGLAGLLSYPMSLMYDQLHGMKWDKRIVCQVAFFAFCFLLLLASLLSAYVALSAVPAHLASPP
ncbi:MAG: DUF981 family protein [Candidatus Micrarchaeaceae archaeon]